MSSNSGRSGSAMQRHSSKMRRLRHRLAKTSRSEPLVVAVLLTETLLRPSWWRAMEYCAWALLSFLRVRRVNRLSVGIAQIRLDNWVALGWLSTTRFSVHNLKLVLGAESNYDACNAFLRRHFPDDAVDLRLLARHYTGGQSLYYARLVRLAVEEIESSSVP